MILSLVYGKQHLIETKVKNKKKTQRIISPTDELKQLLKQRSGITIGDSASMSETFLPKVEFHDNFIFIDVAGIKDTCGNLVEYVNRFMLRSLFQKLHKIKFIVPMTFT